MNNISVSIILPVYNVEAYLRQCVDSVLDQDYENKEIILVDDGSKDGSPAICDEYAKKYDFVKVVHKPNGGLSDARNTGLAYATGEYVLFIDSDDFIEKNSISEIMEVAGRKKADVIFLEAKKYMPDKSTSPLGDGISAEGVRDKSREEALNFIATCPKFPASACTKLIKKELFDNNEDLKFEKGLLSEDIDWCLNLLLKAKTYDYCGVDYYNYRKGRSGSITSRVGSKHLSDMVYILKKWIALAEAMAEYEKRFVLSELAYEYAITMAHYGNLEKAERRKFAADMKNMRWLLDYRSGLRYSGIKLISALFGVNFAGFLLGFYLKIR